MAERPALLAYHHRLEAAGARVARLAALLQDHLGLHRCPRMVHHHILANDRIVVHWTVHAHVPVYHARRQPLPSRHCLRAGIGALHDEIVRGLRLQGGVFGLDAGRATPGAHGDDVGHAAGVYRPAELLLGGRRARRAGNVVVVVHAGPLHQDVLAHGAHLALALHYLKKIKRNIFSKITYTKL